MTIQVIVIAVTTAGVAVGLLIGILVGRRVARARVVDARRVAGGIIEEAQRAAEKVHLQAQEKMRRETRELRTACDEECRIRRAEIETAERDAGKRRDDIDRRVEVLERSEAILIERNQTLEVKQRALDERTAEASRLISAQNSELERVARMTKEEAKRVLMRNMRDEVRMESARRLREIRERAEGEAERDARRIIVMAIQRYAAEQCVETTVSVVALPSEDMKGRIIGREGRNIRAFESAAGVDVVIDDTPGAVVVSSFDPVRREIARLALESLVDDGRIHPGRIEDVIGRMRDEVDRRIRQAGEQACLDLGIKGIARELIDLVGRMRYRTSYGQNCLAHSVEVAFVTGMMAAELNLDQQIGRRAGLLHDLGKVVSHEADGSHTEIGAEIARRYGESADVVNAIRAHHGDVDATSLYTPLVSAADAMSGARPGARREALEAYVKRLSRLEEIADAFDGVEKSYAIQAGREIRIIVNNRKVDDQRASDLAYDVSRRLEKELDYPGQIKVVVIRETRAVEYAR